MGLTLFKIGEEAKVPLESFTIEGSASKDFRYTLRRVEKRGYWFEFISQEKVPDLMPELKKISDAWLKMKSGKEKRFSVGFFDEEYLSNFPIAVIRNETQIVAFANIWKGKDKDEISIDLMRYSPDASDNIMDYLFVNLILWGKENGYKYFSLGMAPLSGFEKRQHSPIWNKIGSFIFTHGEHFYNYKGLRDFKEKFNPVWTPKYIALPKGLKQVFAIKDVAALISGGVKGIFFERTGAQRRHTRKETLDQLTLKISSISNFLNFTMSQKPK
jgi:phosphatidylglycerol lysyltransferase